MKHITNIVLLFLLLVVPSYCMKVGILSDDHDTLKTKKIWSLGQNYSTMMNLEPVVQVTQWWSSLDAAGVARSVCSLVNFGVDALVFLGPPRWNSLISSYSTHHGLPFISALEHSEDLGKYEVSMLPDTSEAASDFIQHFGWNRFTFIYDSDNGPNQLQKVIRLLLSGRFVAQIDAFWRASDADQASRYVNELLQSNINKRIVLATSERFADQLAAKLARGSNFNMLLLTPVGTVQRSSSQGFYKLTKLSVVDSTDSILQLLENRLKTLPSYSARGRTGKELPDSVVLHYDSSSALDSMFNKIVREMPSSLNPRKGVDCLEFPSSIPETADYLKKVIVEHGATGRISFNQGGHRTGYRINIMQTTPFDVQKQPPFLYQNEDGSLRGYVVDLLEELFKEIRLRYDLHLVKDGRYGIQLDGEWQGMVGELVRGEADLAVASLTKTSERGEAIDFSKNFMTSGLNILVKKQQSQMESVALAPFSFLTVWSVETWMVILLAIAGYSAAGYGISRFIGTPDRVRALETKGTDNLSPCGSVWFTVGSLFYRDTGIYPRNLTHRMWTLLWWIFCAFISLLYVSMLTSEVVRARTTVTSVQSSKTSQQVIKDFIDNGVPVIGVVKSGSTMKFFLKSEIGIYQQYGQYLQEHPEVMVNSYLEGVEKVKKSEGKYALIMESTSSKLMADTEPCDTLVTSGLLNTISYAVALRKNSTLKETIDHGILRLMETGILRTLYEKWWHNMTSSCDDPNLDILPKVYNNSMTLYEVSGIFFLLLLFAVISVATAIIEYYIRTRNIGMD